ncbi:5-formyltetrahydrofolate cyclo-ligase-like protein COG0212 [Selaginella moellendorffii]|uniref:5-formyltetrahydrofolate cyclo-ligase-like protein COG0212 n=1 Tax=Selaginella moellendorffii TaxID=88036 RepID=UPI000D1D12BB|nr:5-formyltetrahydrofolate cyclo-ligase-like protein COG0212 [Selaginella moellendorffii]|eukprot:XP_024533163.1 5-formyltetrahydrofolate cyclo-ligase-like protein COG0212 [Selaginella moellendorffii]
MEAALRSRARRAASACWNRLASSRSSSDVAALAESGEAAWKWAVRKKVWSLCESGVSTVPRNRYPVFRGANVAAYTLSRKLPEYRDSFCVCVGSDTVLKPVRTMLLRAKKSVLIPHLQTGTFRMINPAAMTTTQIAEACMKGKFVNFGRDMKMDEFVIVNFIVVGSVAVDPQTGARIGKGDGLEDMEYVLLRRMKINEKTLVVTTVDDKQLVSDMPIELMAKHDVPVDVICTPTRIIFTGTSLPKPTEILWDKLTLERLYELGAVRDVKNKIEKETSKLVKLAPAQTRPPPLKRDDADSDPTIFISELNPTVTEEELQQHLKQLGVREPVSLFKARQKLVARVRVPQGSDIAPSISSIEGSELKGWRLKARQDVWGAQI